MPGPWEQFQQPAADDGGPKPWEQFQAKKAPSKGFGQQLDEAIADAPRQLGLTARYGIEGLGGMANMLTAPVRGAINLALPKGSQIQPMNFSGGADALGLPQPRNGTERIVGDASRMLAGGLVPIGIGGVLSSVGTGAVRGAGQMLAANPGTQLASAAAAGGAGGYTRETGGDTKSQMLASLAAGIATPFAVNGVQRMAQGAGRVIDRMAPQSQSQNAQQQIQVDMTINRALSGDGGPGITLENLPSEVAAGLRKDVADALKISDNLSPDAVRRLADYRLTGLTPNKAGLTLDVGDITRQRNLAKMGVNSKDPAAQALAQMQNSNNMQLTNKLNTLGASTADDQIAGAGRVMDQLQQFDTAARSGIGDLYSAARATGGRSAALDPSAFTQTANNLLDDALLGGKLPGDVRNLLNKTATGQMPLTVDVAEQFKTRLGDLQRSTTDMAERKALGLVRSALDDTPLLAGQDIGQESIGAFNQARMANRKYMQIVERTPALQAIRDGIEPDKFMQKFILSNGPKSNVMDVASLKNAIQSNPDAMTAVREQIAAYLKSQAKAGAADEIANFSQSGYNKALANIGDHKLNLFFPPEEVNQLKALGRVARYEQVQPVGTAVNNSNTASAGFTAMIDRIASSPLIGKIPFGKQIVGDPLQNIVLSAQSQSALSAPRSLVAGPSTAPISGSVPRLPMMSPAALAFPGETEEQRRRRLGLAP